MDLEPLPVIEWINAVLLAAAIACVVGTLAFMAMGASHGQDASPPQA